MVLNMELTPGEFAPKLIIPQSSGQLESDLFFFVFFSEEQLRLKVRLFKSVRRRIARELLKSCMRQPHTLALEPPVEPENSEAKCFCNVFDMM